MIDTDPVMGHDFTSGLEDLRTWRQRLADRVRWGADLVNYWAPLWADRFATEVNYKVGGFDAVMARAWLKAYRLAERIDGSGAT